MTDLEHEQLLTINAKMLKALWKVQLSACGRAGRIIVVLSPDTIREVSMAIIKAEAANHE